MNATEAVTKIKLLLGLNEEVTQEETVVIETEKVQMASVKLVDGTEVSVDGEFEEGKQCFVETEEDKIPAPMGVHQSEDGMLITIDESGVITEITEMEEEVKEEEKVQAEEEVKEEVAMETEEEEVVMEEDEEKVDIVMDVVTALKPFIDNLDELKEKVAAMEANFQTFAKSPATKPIKRVSEDFETQKIERINQIAKFRK